MNRHYHATSRENSTVDPRHHVLKGRFSSRAGSVSDGFPRLNEDESDREGSSLTLPALVFVGNRNSATPKRVSDGFLRLNEDESDREGSSLTLPALAFTGHRDSEPSKTPYVDGYPRAESRGHVYVPK
jgi:hypothetical protein